jgi:hypothetical protein
MANTVLLNNLAHQDLKVVTRFGAEFGDSVSSVLAFPTEFIELQKEYPILFRKNPETQKFHATVLLGLDQGENLFLNPALKAGWDAYYIPAVIARGPFLIGFQSDVDNHKVPVIHIDLDHPKANNEKGYPLFLEHGGNGPYLDHIASILKIIHEGIAMQDAMFNVFTELGLIESVDIGIDLNSGEKQRLVGNFTIHEEKLMTLGGEQLEKLNKLGFLSLAYAVINSMTNIRKLTEIKNKKK